VLFSDLSEPGGPVEIAAGALSGIRVIKFFAGFFWPDGPVVRVKEDRSTEEADAQRGDRAVAAWLLVAARVRGERIQGDLWLIALADQHSERTVAIPAASRGCREPSAQEFESATEFGLQRVEFTVGGLAKNVRSRVGVESSPDERASDALGSPVLELPLIGDEQAREAMVIEAPYVDQCLHRSLGCGGVDALAGQVPLDLAPCPLAPV
jgi:hypothetical protein